MEKQSKISTIKDLAGGPAPTASKFDLKSIPKSEAVVAGGRLVRVPTSTSLPIFVNGGTVEIAVQPSESEWTALDQSYISAVISVVKIVNGRETLLPIGEKVAYNSMVLYSLFRQQSIAINDVIVSGDGDTMYHYSTAMSILALLNRRTQDGPLASTALFWSTPGTLTETDPTTGTNPGLKLRYEMAELSARSELAGPLMNPLSFTSRAFPPLTDFKFRFTLNFPYATLITPPPGVGAQVPDFRIVLHSFDLYIQRYRLFPKAEETIWRGLGPAKNCLYPVAVPRVTTMSIETGNYAGEKLLSYGGLARLPTFILIGLIDRNNSLSMTSGDKYNFAHFNVDEVAVSVDDVNYPPPPGYKPDFSTHRFGAAYYTTQRELIWANDDRFGGYDAFNGGYTLWPISLTNTMCPMDQVEVRPVEVGTLTVKVKLKTPTTTPITVIIVSYYQQVLQIGRDRMPKWLD